MGRNTLSQSLSKWGADPPWGTLNEAENNQIHLVAENKCECLVASKNIRIQVCKNYTESETARQRHTMRRKEALFIDRIQNMKKSGYLTVNEESWTFYLKYSWGRGELWTDRNPHQGCGISFIMLAFQFFYGTRHHTQFFNHHQPSPPLLPVAQHWVLLSALCGGLACVNMTDWASVGSLIASFHGCESVLWSGRVNKVWIQPQREWRKEEWWNEEWPERWTERSTSMNTRCGGKEERRRAAGREISVKTEILRWNEEVLSMRWWRCEDIRK